MKWWNLLANCCHIGVCLTFIVSQLDCNMVSRDEQVLKRTFHTNTKKNSKSLALIKELIRRQ